jgi:hypothetical protein
MDMLLRDLEHRGRLRDGVPGGTDLALLLIEEYVRFPPPSAATDG